MSDLSHVVAPLIAHLEASGDSLEEFKAEAQYRFEEASQATAAVDTRLTDVKDDTQMQISSLGAEIDELRELLEKLQRRPQMASTAVQAVETSDLAVQVVREESEVSEAEPAFSSVESEVYGAQSAPIRSPRPSSRPSSRLAPLRAPRLSLPAARTEQTVAASEGAAAPTEVRTAPRRVKTASERRRERDGGDLRRARSLSTLVPTARQPEVLHSKPTSIGVARAPSPVRTFTPRLEAAVAVEGATEPEAEPGSEYDAYETGDVASEELADELELTEAQDGLPDSECDAQEASDERTESEHSDPAQHGGIEAEALAPQLDLHAIAKTVAGLIASDSAETELRLRTLERTARLLTTTIEAFGVPERHRRGSLGLPGDFSSHDLHTDELPEGSVDVGLEVSSVSEFEVSFHDAEESEEEVPEEPQRDTPLTLRTAELGRFATKRLLDHTTVDLRGAITDIAAKVRDIRGEQKHVEKALGRKYDKTRIVGVLRRIERLEKALPAVLAELEIFSKNIGLTEGPGDEACLVCGRPMPIRGCRVPATTVGEIGPLPYELERIERGQAVGRHGEVVCTPVGDMYTLSDTRQAAEVPLPRARLERSARVHQPEYQAEIVGRGSKRKPVKRAAPVSMRPEGIAPAMPSMVIQSAQGERSTSDRRPALN